MILFLGILVGGMSSFVGESGKCFLRLWVVGFGVVLNGWIWKF